MKTKMTMQKQIAKFKKETGIQLEVRDNKPYYYGGLSLFKMPVTSLPDNLVVNGHLDLSYTKITELPKNLVVVGTLTSSYTAITSLPDGIVVGHSIDLRNTEIVSLPDNLVVNGYLDLSYTKITELPKNLIIRAFLLLRGTNITTLPSDLIVAKEIVLSETSIKSLPDNFIVGGNLNLSNTKIAELPNNLIVGGWLDLVNTKITKLPDSLIVGGWVSRYNTPLSNYYIEKANNNIPDILSWRNGKYILCDNIFSKVIEHKGNVWKLQSLLDKTTMYLVTDGNGKYAHGKTIKEAKEDLLYKISNRDKSLYKDLTLNSEVTFEQAIVMYRVITGACELGTKDFVENRLKVKKDTYTVAELIELTKGEYQSKVFERFFNKVA